MKKYFLIFLLFIFSCSGPNQERIPASGEKKIIYTSFYPIYFLTTSLLKEPAQIINIVPNGGEPHEFEPSLKQIGEMQKADIVILNGLGIENYEEKLTENLGTQKVIIVSEELKNLISLGSSSSSVGNNESLHAHGNTDPHTWLSPKVYFQMGEILSQYLKEKGYQVDETFLEQLSALDKSYESGLKNCSEKKLLTSHDAFGYLARDYGLKQIPLLGISPEEEPSVKDMAEIIQVIKKEHIPSLFSEAFVSQKFAQTIQKETGVQVFTLHPLETLSENEVLEKKNYISIMNSNLEKLKLGLNCK